MKHAIFVSMFVLAFIVKPNLIFGQKLTKFQFSDCLQNCENDSSKIHEIKKQEELTTIRLRTYAPCNGNLAGGFEILKDTLNLKFWTKPWKTYKDKQGRTVEVVDIADCDCIFDFEYHIKGLTRVFIDKKIKVNGKTLREIDRESIIIEDDDID